MNSIWTQSEINLCLNRRRKLLIIVVDFFAGNLPLDDSRRRCLWQRQRRQTRCQIRDTGIKIRPWQSFGCKRKRIWLQSTSRIGINSRAKLLTKFSILFNCIHWRYLKYAAIWFCRAWIFVYTVYCYVSLCNRSCQTALMLVAFSV